MATSYRATPISPVRSAPAIPPLEAHLTYISCSQGPCPAELSPEGLEGRNLRATQSCDLPCMLEAFVREEEELPFPLLKACWYHPQWGTVWICPPKPQWPSLAE